jgi:hypothetical protein
MRRALLFAAAWLVANVVVGLAVVGGCAPRPERTVHAVLYDVDFMNERTFVARLMSDGSVVVDTMPGRWYGMSVAP